MEEFTIMLAPMEGRTNAKFREECHNNGADETFTEMARITSLARNNQATIKKTLITNNVPTHIQLIGSNEKDLETYLKNFKPQKGFLGFNLNLGCSTQKMVQKGLGSAMIKRTSKVERMIKIIKSHGHKASIKLRLGMNEYEKERRTYINLIKETSADFYIVHARHGKETYNEKADFDAYIECVKTKKTIIANGDIQTKGQIKYLKRIGIKGAMIGRAAINNKNIFKEIKKD